MIGKITRALSVYAGWIVLYLALAYVAGVAMIWATGLHAALHSVGIRLAVGFMVIGVGKAFGEPFNKAREAYRA